MHRIRVGLTGLGLVFLLVFVAAAGLRPSHSVSASGAGGETLSVLGVVPAQDVQKAPPAGPSPPQPPQPPQRAAPPHRATTATAAGRS